MGDSSGGEQNCSGITDLKILIENIKDQYKKSNPNDDRWPCRTLSILFRNIKN